MWTMPVSSSADEAVLVIDRPYLCGPWASRSWRGCARSPTSRSAIWSTPTITATIPSGTPLFPAETLLIQQRETALRTPYIEDEKAFSAALRRRRPGKPSTGVAYRARPDNRVRRPAGPSIWANQTVELYWFGARQHRPADTITYAPAARTAWTGNMTVGRVRPGAGERRADLSGGRSPASPRTIAPQNPGERPTRRWPTASVIGQYMVYFQRAYQRGENKRSATALSLADAEENASLCFDAFAPPPDHPRPDIVAGRHRYNVRRTYLSLAA